MRKEEKMIYVKTKFLKDRQSEVKTFKTEKDAKEFAKKQCKRKDVNFCLLYVDDNLIGVYEDKSIIEL